MRSRPNHSEWMDALAFAFAFALAFALALAFAFALALAFALAGRCPMPRLEISCMRYFALRSSIRRPRVQQDHSILPSCIFLNSVLTLPLSHCLTTASPASLLAMGE